MFSRETNLLGREKNIFFFLRFSEIAIYGCESWTVKKAERRRIDAFEL